MPTLHVTPPATSSKPAPSAIPPDTRLTPAKPAKPYPLFPLFAHATGRWAKKIRGALHYFGPWADPDAALAKYLDQKDALHSGRKPRPETGAVTVKDIANGFLNAKQSLVDAGELSPRSFVDYKCAADALVSHCGKARLADDVQPEDFASLRVKLAKTLGPHRLAKTIQIVRMVFKHAYEAGLLDRPVRFGPGFSRPSKKTLRVHRAKGGEKLFRAEEVRKLIRTAGPALKAMTLLGVNAGLGNSDVGHLPLSALDLDGGWLVYPRPKTGVARRCPLWPETVQALHEAIAARPTPKPDSGAEGLVFVTKYGLSWSKDTADNPVTKELRKLLDTLGLAGGRKGFYTLRHTFRTVADEARDQPAADSIMGHESSHMSTHYRERISDLRLRAVSDYVRQWLFGPSREGATP